MVPDLLALPVGAGRMAAWRVRLLCLAAGRRLLVPPQHHGPSRTTDTYNRQQCSTATRKLGWAISKVLVMPGRDWLAGSESDRRNNTIQ
jgi:hypothetical protein